MATFREKFGYEWTADEREKRKAMQRKVQNLLRGTQEQCRRIGMHVPEFKSAAEQAFAHLSDGLGSVGFFDLSNRSAKYKPITPEEFDRIIATLPELMKPWQTLQSSPEFAAAVRSKNREIRSQSTRIREQNRVIAAQNEAAWKQLDAALRKVDEGDFSGALDIAAKGGFL